MVVPSTLMIPSKSIALPDSDKLFPSLSKAMVPSPARPLPLFVRLPAIVAVLPELIVRAKPLEISRFWQVNVPGEVLEEIMASVVASGPITLLQVAPSQVTAEGLQGRV